MATIKKVVGVTFAVCLLFMTLVMSFPFAQIFASADGEIINYNLLLTAPEYYDNATTVYGVAEDEKEPYTPFNYTEELYYNGWSIKPKRNQYSEIDSTYNVLSNGVINTENKSLFVWIYFSNIWLHNYFKITLSSTSGDVVIDMYGENLQEILKKEDSDAYFGYSWNLLEFPLQSGDYDFKTIRFQMYSAEQVENVNKTEINIYNAYISNSKANYINAITKQKYTDFKAKYPTEAKLETIYKGDSLTFPSDISNALDYAIDGKYNLLTESSAIWKVIVRVDGVLQEPLNLGDTLTFDKEARYDIYYEAFFNGETTTSSVFSVNVQPFVGLYFDNTVYNKLVVGKSYILTYVISQKLITTSDISLVYNSEYIDAVLEEDGKVKVTVKKAGETSLTLKINGIRPGKTEPTEHSCKATINIVKEKVDDFYIFAIVSYVALGIAFVCFIGFLIKSFVNGRRIKVK